MKYIMSLLKYIGIVILVSAIMTVLMLIPGEVELSNNQAIVVVVVSLILMAIGLKAIIEDGK